MKWMERLEQRMLEHELDYPAWIIVLTDSVVFVCLAAGLIQRWPAEPISWLVVAVSAICNLYFIFYRWLSPTLYGFEMSAVLAVLLLEPVHPDIAPFALIMVTAIVAATRSWVVSLAVLAVGDVVMGFAAYNGHLESGWLYVLGNEFGWIAGFIVWAQQRLLRQMRETQDARSEQAAADERRRIAGEVHDVVAHSLTATMLHLTGARRALELDRNVDTAVDSLRNAERSGRQALADIRNTVGILNGGSGVAHPEPTADDIHTLVDGFRGTGFRVRYEVNGPLEDVSAATGLGLYRIAQESLTNIAKHAPGASVDAELQVADGGVALAIRNTVPLGTKVDRERDSGNGLAGMVRRAEAVGGSLEAGPDGDGWLVRVLIPGGRGERPCLLKWLPRNG